MDQKKSALVTGDIVDDFHLYGDGRESVSATSWTRVPGGADLTLTLLEASNQAAGASFGVSPGLRRNVSDEGAPAELPEELRSYGVWTPHAAEKEGDPNVWRTQTYFGYGKSSSATAALPFEQFPDAPKDPDLILLDDGAIHFRHAVWRKLWPEPFCPAPHRKPSHILLKMSAPVCRGDLWARLSKDAEIASRLIVCVLASDLRLDNALVRGRLSWEETVEDTLIALDKHPMAQQLRRAAHVLVTYGSAGTLWLRPHPEGDGNGTRPTRLIYDPERLEGEFARTYDGIVYGFQTCQVAAMAHHLLVQRTDDLRAEARIGLGIVAGLTARRRLIKLGHGEVGAPNPGFPTDEIAQAIAEEPSGLAEAEIPEEAWKSGKKNPWRLLVSLQGTEATRSVPLVGLAKLVACSGIEALGSAPLLSKGKLVTADRREIESLRTLEHLIRTYENKKIQERPLSIGVFGPPGAGKSYGVKALVDALLGNDVPLLEFNLSQFKGPDELIGAFHQVRDAVLRGITPVAFWDEFDSQRNRWLQYLLAPMQDGCFHEGQITHPIGKAIFVFAGGTASSLAKFDRKKPKKIPPADLKKMEPRAYEDYLEEKRNHREFRLLKGPDFVSRFHGYLDVLGPNPANKQDVIYPLRRALMLRGSLKLKPKTPLKIDPGLLHALLSVSKFEHGTRSLEKVVLALASAGSSQLTRSDLPPEPLLDRETDAGKFHSLMKEHTDFLEGVDIEALAAAIHHTYLDAEKQAAIDAIVKNSPEKAWILHPAVRRPYDELSEDMKISNRAAALRIADHLGMIDFKPAPRSKGDDESWVKPLEAAIEKHLDRMAEAEHLGWCEERRANGWTYSDVRDNAKKLHPALKPWIDLTLQDKDKDRSSVRSIPDLLKVAGLKAVPLSMGA